MKSARIPINFWRKPPFAMAGDSQLGAWLKLIAYCFEHENGGVIADCKGWSNTCWLACTGTDSETAQMVVIQGLASWEEKSLRVTAYPLDDEVAYKKKVEGGKRGRDERYAKAGYATGIPAGLAGQDRTGTEGTGEESRDDRQRQFLISLGAKMERNGVDLLPEWLAETKGLKQSSIESIFKEAIPGIQWPSQFKAWRASKAVY